MKGKCTSYIFYDFYSSLGNYGALLLAIRLDFIRTSEDIYSRNIFRSFWDDRKSRDLE